MRHITQTAVAVIVVVGLVFWFSWRSVSGPLLVGLVVLATIFGTLAGLEQKRLERRWMRSWSRANRILVVSLVLGMAALAIYARLGGASLKRSRFVRLSEPTEQ